MEIVGVYPVEGVDCFLIEAIVSGVAFQPDFAMVAQPVDGLAESEWQVAYDEVLLDSEGTAVVADLWQTTVRDWPLLARVAFYLHCLDLERPISTPFGDLTVPPPTQRPGRLAILRYEAP